MDDFAGHVRAVTRITLFFLSFCLAAWAFLPAARPALGGLAVGVLASLMNGLYLAWKVNRIGQVAMENAKKRVGLGFFSRACIAVFAVIVSERLQFSFAATIAGLFFFQLATLLLGLISLRKKPD